MRITLVASAVVALLATAGPAAAKTDSKPCARKGSTTVAATKRVRVYEVPNKDGASNLFGCLRADGKHRILAKGYDDGLVTSGVYDHVRVAGRFVAWQYTETDISCKADCPPGYDPTSAHLSVRDLRRKGRVRVAGEIVPKGRLVLTKGGAIAWSASRPDNDAIEAFDAAGKRTLDTGQIPPGSLALRDGNLATWKNGGVERSARLKSRG
ncbi:MAG: hypothetical protein QOJ57_3046 [Thermoleophilaceae bacterium]|jgi:hypothetical protein|nr:hypothetical protein [Thermoleophilaceae bacterium]